MNSDETAGQSNDSLATVEDPWIYLRNAKDLDQQERAPYLQRFLDLVGARPATERDALLSAGKEVWRYRLETARAALKDQEDEATGLRIQPTVITDDILAEAVYRPKLDPQVGYMVHTFARPDDPPLFRDNIQVGRTTYRPPFSRLMEIGTVLFPSGAEEYGSSQDLYDNLVEFVNTYLKLDSDAFRTLACCYVLMTWVFDRFTVLPYLRAQGELGTGKTRLLQTVGSLCYRPVMAGGATTAAPIFRIIDRMNGCTLIVDEFDFERNDMWDEIVKILNMGNQKGFTVLRAERSGNNDAFDVTAYDTYGPKILASRRRFNDAALESRCLTHVTVHHDTDQLPQLALDKKFFERAQQLRNQLLLWRFRVYQRVEIDPMEKLPNIEPRINQIVMPLLACMDEAALQGRIRRMVWDYSTRIQTEKRESLAGQIAGELLRQWALRKQPDRMMQKVITEAMRQDHDHDRLSSVKVSDVLRNNLFVPCSSSGGHAWVHVDLAHARRLAKQYGWALSDYNISTDVKP